VVKGSTMSMKVIEQYCNCADEALLVLVSQKNVDAFEELYDRHARVVFNLLLRVIRDASVAEELLQDTFWQVWQKAEQFEGSGSAAAWLLRIARNKALDQLRRQRCRPQANEDALEKFEHLSTPHSQNTEQEVERRWTYQHIASALEQLPGEQRCCLELAYFDGLSQSEIAVSTHLPLGTIKTRLRIGREKVERLLRAVGYGESHTTRRLVHRT
jgi:RNA polymerase sigma-70 factor (ECF subfamily)